jgi:hypothetical protein
MLIGIIDQHLLSRKMVNSLLKNWGRRYGLTLTQVKSLYHLCDVWATKATHKRNGDPHREVQDPTDKKACSAAWEDDCERTEQRLTALATQLGFDRVDYESGHFPVFAKGSERRILVPNRDKETPRGTN